MHATRTLWLIALLAAAPALAQDPVTGSWRVEMTPSGGSTRQATMELRYDGKTAVTGTIVGKPSPADIKGGSYDPTKKTLTLPMGPTGGSSALLTLTGTLVNAIATGTVVGTDGSEGTFLLTRAGQSAAQAGGVSDASAAVRAGFAEVSGWVTKAAELIPDDRYSYKPTTSVRTVGQMLGHIADSYGYYCGRAAKRDVQWSDAIEKGATDKATLAPRLKQALDGCTAAYATGTGDIGQLMANVAHTSLHYGNLITYIRMLGMTPPSS
jgi:uncharacterized damage-inducible protein DinB